MTTWQIVALIVLAPLAAACAWSIVMRPPIVEVDEEDMRRFIEDRLGRRRPALAWRGVPREPGRYYCRHVDRPDVHWIVDLGVEAVRQAPFALWWADHEFAGPLPMPVEAHAEPLEAAR